MPDFSFEKRLLDLGTWPVAGIDEAGHGPLAGPVVAAAVILNPADIPAGLRDSKKLTVLQRRKLYDDITSRATYAIGIASVAEIDRVNILQATYLAMRRAVDALAKTPAHLLIDGNRLPPGLPCPAEAIVKGDDRSASIAAASIVAKVRRDGIMADLDQAHPGYGWSKNAGYGSKQHLDALKTLGVTPHHRVSFRPVHNILYQVE